MHYSYLVGKGGLAPTQVPVMAGVDIDWVHRNEAGNPDLPASSAGANAMIAGYEIVYAPVLASRHTEGKAIDMDIAWNGVLVIAQANGQTASISSPPRSCGNQALQKVGATYGVIKLVTDPPHWSSDGH